MAENEANFWNQDRFKMIASTAAIIGITGLIISEASRLAFKTKTRKSIKSWARNRSEVSNENGRPLECSHVNHDRDSGYYNNPINGMLLTDEEHWIQHTDFIGYARFIGLTEEENGWAIDELQIRIDDFNSQHNIPPMSDEFAEKLSQRIDQLSGIRARKLGIPNPYDLLWASTADSEAA
jgi:hypothetical protein